MRVRVDHKADAVYLNLADRESWGAKRSRTASSWTVVGLEILDASRRTGDPGVLKQFSSDLHRSSYRVLGYLFQARSESPWEVSALPKAAVMHEENAWST